MAASKVRPSASASSTSKARSHPSKRRTGLTVKGKAGVRLLFKQGIPAQDATFTGQLTESFHKAKLAALRAGVK